MFRIATDGSHPRRRNVVLWLVVEVDIPPVLRVLSPLVGIAAMAFAWTWERSLASNPWLSQRLAMGGSRLKPLGFHDSPNPSSAFRSFPLHLNPIAILVLGPREWHLISRHTQTPSLDRIGQGHAFAPCT